MNTERLKDHDFEWTPLSSRVSRLPIDPLSAQQLNQEKRRPYLWIASRKIDTYTYALYLINEMKENLDIVTIEKWGYRLFEDAVVPLKSPGSYSYEHVCNREAVKLDEIHEINDSEGTIGIALHIESTTLGSKEFSITLSNSFKHATVLLWDTMELGKF